MLGALIVYTLKHQTIMQSIKMFMKRGGETVCIDVLNDDVFINTAVIHGPFTEKCSL
jgi:hypothetical protein